MLKGCLEFTHLTIFSNILNGQCGASSEIGSLKHKEIYTQNTEMSLYSD